MFTYKNHVTYCLLFLFLWFSAALCDSPCRFAGMSGTTQSTHNGRVYNNWYIITTVDVNREDLTALGFVNVDKEHSDSSRLFWYGEWPADVRMCGIPPFVLNLNWVPQIVPDLDVSADYTASSTQDSTRKAFVWTDSLIAARGPFASAPPPEVALPDTIDDKLYWLGGVFVLPGTKASVLNENGFLDVEHKPGSVMHDYYEARWQIDMKLDSLPLSVRQVRYGQKRQEWNRPEWHKVSLPPENMLKELRFNNANTQVIPGLPKEFFKAYGWRLYPEPQAVNSWSTEYYCDWPQNTPDSLLPPEAYELTARPNKIPTVRNGNGMSRANDTIYHCERMYNNGSAVIESIPDTTLLIENSFYLVAFSLFGATKTINGNYNVRIVWPPELVIETLPSQILMVIQQQNAP